MVFRLLTSGLLVPRQGMSQGMAGRGSLGSFSCLQPLRPRLVPHELCDLFKGKILPPDRNSKRGRWIGSAHTVVGKIHWCAALRGPLHSGNFWRNSMEILIWLLQEVLLSARPGGIDYKSSQSGGWGRRLTSSRLALGNRTRHCLKNFSKLKVERGLGCSSVSEHLPSMCENSVSISGYRIASFPQMELYIIGSNLQI